MALQFAVNKGPLSQIVVPLFDLKSAAQLAVGVYGWWKARERVASLAQVLETANCELSPTSTFDLQVYKNRCAPKEALIVVAGAMKALSKER
jgi:hypothetical protein